MRNFQRALLAGAVALAVSAPAAAQFTEHLLLRRQPDRRGRSSRRAAGTGLSRRIRDRSGRRIFGATLRLRDHAVEPGRHRLRAGRRARHRAAGVPTAPPTRRSARSRRRSRSCSRAARSTATRSTRSGAAPTTSSSNLGLLSAGAITPAQAQATWRRRAADSAQQVALLQAAGAHYIIVVQPARRRQDAGRRSQRPGGAADQRARRTLQHDADRRRSTQLGVQTIRVNIFALFNEVLAESGVVRLHERDGASRARRRRFFCTPSTLVAPDARADVSSSPTASIRRRPGTRSSRRSSTR